MVSEYERKSKFCSANGSDNSWGPFMILFLRRQAKIKIFFSRFHRRKPYEHTFRSKFRMGQDKTGQDKTGQDKKNRNRSQF
jgi:hypothetical protein